MNVIPDIHTFVQETLDTLLNSVSDGFEDGELAYLRQERKVDEYRPIIAYSNYLTSNVKYRTDPDYISAIQSYWEEFNDKLITPVKIQEPQVIFIGEAYGYKQYLSPLIIGPLKMI